MAAAKKKGPSTRNLDALPEPTRLRMLTQSLALLDTILCDDESMRYFAFDPKWGKKEVLASMNNGEGDTWFLWFSPKGIVLLGFAHEAAPMTPYARKDHSLWPGLLEGFPKSLASALKEPAFSPEDLTFVIWRETGDDRWRTGKVEFPKRKAVEPFASDPDGSAELLEMLDGDPKTYAKFASEYYETKVPLAAVKSVYAHEPIDRKLVTSLSRDADFDEVAEVAAALGFKVRAG